MHAPLAVWFAAGLHAIPAAQQHGRRHMVIPFGWPGEALRIWVDNLFPTQFNTSLRATQSWRHAAPEARRRPLTALEELELCGGGVGDAGARELGGLSRLRVLSLANNGALSDRAAPPLARLTALRELNLSGARRVTGNGVLLFQALLVRGRPRPAPRPRARRPSGRAAAPRGPAGGRRGPLAAPDQPGLPGAGGSLAAASAVVRAAVAPVPQRTKRACGAMQVSAWR